MKVNKYYKMTEQILKEYNYMLHVIKLINLELEEETNTDHVSKLKYIKNKHEIIIKKIDIAINNLSPLHREIIEYKYIKKLSWNEIIDKTCYSERSLRNKKNEAVRCIAIALFGVNVFKEEKYDLFNLIENNCR